MAPYPRKLTRAEWTRRNPGGNYGSYERAYERQKARRQQAKQNRPPVDPFAALLGAGPALPDLTGLTAQAQALAQAQLQPQMMALQGQMGAITGAANQGMQQLGGLSSAAARLARGIAPQVQSAYSGAASAQAGFAKGFSDAMRELAAQDAAKNSAQLGMLGAPAEQIQQVADVGKGGPDAMYASQGYIPSSTMGREGAAWTANAAAYPAILSRMGQQDAQALGLQAGAQRGSIAHSMAAAQAQGPAMFQQALSDLQNQKLDEYELARRAYEADREWKLKILAAQEIDRAARGLPSALTGTPPSGAAPPSVTAGGGGGTTSSPAPTTGPGRQPAKSPERTAYKQSIAEDVPKLYEALLTQVNKSRKEAWEQPAVDPITGLPTDGSRGEFVARKPTYNHALSAIYGALLSAYKNDKGRWRYGVKGKAINAIIRQYLAKQGIKPSAGGRV